MQGLGVSLKGHAALWTAGLLFICGMPPSVLFFTELGLVFSASAWMSALVLGLLFVVFAAMMKVGLAMTMGLPVATPAPVPRRLLVVPWTLFTLLACAGVFACTIPFLSMAN